MARYNHRGIKIHKDEVGKHLVGYTGLAHWFIEETRTLKGDFIPLTRLDRVYFFTINEAKQYINNFE